MGVTKCNFSLLTQTSHPRLKLFMAEIKTFYTCLNPIKTRVHKFQNSSLCHLRQTPLQKTVHYYSKIFCKFTLSLSKQKQISVHPSFTKMAPKKSTSSSTELVIKITEGLVVDWKYLYEHPQINLTNMMDLVTQSGLQTLLTQYSYFFPTEVDIFWKNAKLSADNKSISCMIPL